MLTSPNTVHTEKSKFGVRCLNDFLMIQNIQKEREAQTLDV